MTDRPEDSVERDYEALCRRFDAPLRAIAKQATRVWFNRDRLDHVLSEKVHICPNCDLIYAINSEGRQVSSNIYADHIDQSAYGQDLSRRPYAVRLSVLNNPAFRGTFICDAYISHITQRPCVTVMCGITSGASTLGFIAADIDVQNLPSV